MKDLSFSDYLEIQQFIQNTAALLDEEKLSEWAALFAPTGRYEITSFSTELRRDLVWWRADYGELEKTLREVKRHVRDPASRLRVLGQPLIQVQEDKVSVRTAFSIYRTSRAGESSLYLVGRYEDQLVREPQSWRYKEHHVRLSTRVLAAFTHLPL